MSIHCDQIRTENKYNFNTPQTTCEQLGIQEERERQACKEPSKPLENRRSRGGKQLWDRLIKQKDALIDLHGDRGFAPPTYLKRYDYLEMNIIKGIQ